MATMTLNTANMASPQQFPEYRDLFKFPEYTLPPVKLLVYHEPPANMSSIESPKPNAVHPNNDSTESLVRTPGRKPSPQPAHFSVPVNLRNGNGNGHRILRSATVGYIAPEFKGKQAQMEQGMHIKPVDNHI